jgi:hypothetical protein
MGTIDEDFGAILIGVGTHAQCTPLPSHSVTIAYRRVNLIRRQHLTDSSLFSSVLPNRFTSFMDADTHS